MLLPIEIPESERTPLVNWLLNLVAEQKQVIENQEKTIADLERKVARLEKQVKGLDEELKAAKKLKSRTKIKPSTLNQEKKTPQEGEKRAGSEKRSKKTSFIPDEERLIEPEELPEGATFNGYREYDVQDLIIQRHNIRFLLAEYVTPEGKTIVGKLPPEYQGHYGPTLIAFTLYQHHQCRVPQTLILEELRELGIDISAGLVNRILIENKESFHQEQEQIFQVGLSTAEYIHTDDTGARHQGKNGFCTVIGNDLFAYFSSSNSKSRENYLRIWRGTQEDFVLNEYSLRYLEEHQLAASHLAKLQFSSQVLSQGDEQWSQYLESLGITSTTAVKLVTEAALLGSAIEGGVSPQLIVLSDGARQFAILVHALCWVHMERGIRRLPGATAQRKISGGTRHDDGRRARDTFTGLKKTCRKLAVSFWQYLLSRCLGDKTVSYLPELLRARAAPQNGLSLEVGH
jgi:uncharacterized coiled-coil protein SlyX